MAYDDEQLDQAFSTLEILTVARHFGIEGLKEGVVTKSPFREDKNGKSFSIYRDTRTGNFSSWKDHANGDGGGVWNFAKEAAPAMEGKDIRNLLVELSGQDPKRLTRGQVKREVAAKRQDLYKDQAKALADLPTIKTPIPGPWSMQVRARYEEGKGVLVGLADKIAATRGWAGRVIVDLIAMGKTSSVELPWNRGRAWAWMVEKPAPKKGAGGRDLDLVPVGYHGRYKYRNPDKTFKKMWSYIPSIPGDKKKDGTPKHLTPFQEHLKALGMGIPAYPFVIGDLCKPVLVVVLEGQFDAVSFAEAFGWIEGGFPAGVSVFGLRGVQSQVPFLAAYGFWLKKNQPAVWIIGDNDAAGVKLAEYDASGNIVREPSFIERIRAQGCTVKAEVIGHPGCKDFNDVFKAGRPSLEVMKAWSALRGFEEFTK